MPTREDIDRFIEKNS